MVQKLIEWLSVKNKKGVLIKVGIFLAVILPVIAVATAGYISTKKNLTELTLTRREAMAQLAATTLKERLDHLTDLATSFATRLLVVKMVEEGKWEDAVLALKDVPVDFPYVERIFIADVAGTLMADVPTLPGVQGKNFSERDWYKGVMQTQKTYVSEIYKRTAEPQYNVIAVAAPIRNEKREVVGILVAQVRLDTLLEWGRNIDVGRSGFLYFVDRNGSVVGHPQVSPQQEIMRIADEAHVQEVLRGKRGVKIYPADSDRHERIISYAPVQKYGWGVITEQPNPPAFAVRDTTLRQRLIVIAVALAIVLLLAYLIVRFVSILSEYRQRERIFLDSIGDGVVAIDRYWNITLWNKAASALSGWSKEEAVGKPFREIIKLYQEKDRKENIVFIEDAIVRGKVGILTNDTVLIKKDKSEIPVGDSAAPVFDKEGMIIGAIIVFRDVSQEKDRQRLRSDFAYASHQLRTPITKALWSLEAAMGKKTIEEMRQEIENAHQAAQSVNRLSEELIEVSKIDQKEVRVAKQMVKLVDLYTETVDMQQEAKKRNIDLQKPTIPATTGINTDPKIFKRIVREVLDNAIKYSELNGMVKISADVKGDMLEIAIEDFGTGIMEEERPLVFTKFFRGRNIDTTAIVGAGLGLYIAQAYAKLLGGKIWFESKEKGTIFYITLPAA